MNKKLLIICLLFLSGIVASRAQVYTMSNTAINACSGTLYDQGGSNNYANSQDITMTICSGSAQQVWLQFTQFSTENNFDYLYIYNGPNTSSPSLGTFTGSTSPGTVVASSGCITIRFTSDGSVTYPGFTASVGCGATPPPPPPASTSCAGANPFCTSTGASFPAATNNGQAPAGPAYGCLGSEPNPAWYYLEIANSGPIDIVMTGTSDVDFILWGPFTSATGACLAGLTSGTIVDCSFSSSATENINIANGVTGEYYVLLITNFANVAQNISFSQSGGSGSTNCAILCNINALTATPSACDPATNTYSVSGTITTYAPPGTGTLTVSSSCGGSVTYNPPFSTSINYTIPGIVPTGGSCTITASYSADAQCTKTATYTSPASCSSCSLTASNSGPICSNGNLTLTATAVAGATSYTWTNPGGTTVGTGQTITLNNVTTGGTYTVTATTASTSCIATTSVVVNSIPTPAASNNGPVCQGATLNLTATGGGTYSWTGPNGFSSAAATPSISNAGTAATGVYTVTVTSAAGCSATTTTSATVNVLPTPTASSNSPVCENATLNLSATGGGSYSWSGPNSFTSTSATPSITNVTSAAAGSYSLTVTSAAGCTASASTTVVINPLPTPTASNNGPVCSGSTLNMTATGGGTYSWTGPGAFTSTSATPGITNVTTAASGTYTVSVTSAAGCTATATTTATVNSLPIPAAGSNTPVCENNALNLSGSGGGTYSWSGPNGFMSTIASPVISNVTTAASGNYTLTVTSAAGCIDSATTTVVINPLPLVTASNNGPVCTNNTLILTATGGGTYSWTGPNSFTSTNASPSITNAQPGASGLYTVVVTSAAGCSATANTTATVNSSLAVTASSNSPVCEGGTLNLSVNGGSTFSWTGPNSFSSTVASPVINTVTPANSGTYTVTATDANGCSNTVSTNVVINPLPAVTASNNSPICDGDALTLNANGGINYSWTGPNSFTAVISNPGINPAGINASGTYNVTVTDANGCVNTASTNVVVNSLPVVSVSSNSPVCQGTTLSITAGGGTTYQWSGPNSYTSGNATNNINNVPLNAAGSYTVIVTDANGCINVNSVNVTVNSLPVISIGNSGPVCSGANLSLNATGGTNYSWSGPNNFSAPIDQPVINNVTTQASGIYTVTVTDSNGCIDSSTTNVTINPLPVPVASNDGPKCPGSQICFNATGGTSYSWTGPNGFNSIVSNPCIPSITDADTGTYTVTVIDANGCVASISSNLSIYSIPGVAAVNDGPKCDGQTITLSATGGVSYSWSGPGGFSGSSASVSITSPDTLNSGTYSVIVTDANGCSNTTTTDIVINPLPVIQVSNDGPKCEGQSITITASGASNYSWTGPGAFIASGTSIIINNINASNTGTYSVIATDANGCQNSGNTTISYYPTPVPGASNDGPQCEDNTVNFSSNGGVSYLWSGPNGFVSTIATPLIPVVSSNDAGTYTVIVTDANGCVATTTTLLTVYPNPVADFTYTPTCQNSCTPFNSTSTVSSGTINNYIWSFGDGIGGGTNSSECYSYTACGNYNVTLVVTSDNGCPDVKTIPVQVLCVPTASFTAGNECAYTPSTFNNTSTGTGSISYIWDFDTQGGNITVDQTTTSVNPGTSHLYSSPGTYTVTLVANINGCTNNATQNVTIYPVPQASYTASEVCQGLPTLFTSNSSIQSPSSITTYQWNYQYAGIFNADATTSSGSSSNIYSATYNGPAALVVTSDNGCSDTAFANVTVNPNPDANFTFSNACLGFPNQFTSTSTVASGSIAQTLWNYNYPGISTGSGVSTSNIYNTDGSYNVQLLVITDNGCRDSITSLVQVYPKPQPGFISDAQEGCEPTCINFSSNSTINTGSIATYTWSFGDGNNASSGTASNCYQEDGNYSVRLSLVSDMGCRDSILYNNYITIHPVPRAAFGVTPNATTILNPVFTLIDSSLLSTDVIWNFGDGNPSVTQLPEYFSHTYQDTGVYIITQTVYTEYGCADSIKRLVYVQPDWTLYIPSAFTPNDDNKNEKFMARGIGISSFEMRIFDRWGNIISLINEYSETAGWDGKDSKTNEFCPEGVYVYEIRVKDLKSADHHFVGKVQLLK